MSEIVIAIWQHQHRATSSAWVYPDGCRDLIMRQKSDAEPIWYLTSLDESARLVEGLPNEHVRGFRLSPGATLNESGLLSFVQGQHPLEIDISTAISEYSSLDSDTEEALSYLSDGFNTVESAAKAIGVSVRTLQRKLASTTGKPPTFWQSLARARKSAMDFASDKPFAEIASENGYSDQAHLTRETRRWFCHTPRQIRNDPQQLSLILERGFCSLNRI